MQLRPLARAAAVSAALATATLAIAADSNSTVPTKRPTDQETGQTVWAQSCSSCHGPKGLGDGPLAAALGGVKTLKGAITPATLDAMTGVVRNGKDKMPAYSETIDAGDTRRILEWIRDISDGRIQPKIAKPKDESGIKKPDPEAAREVAAEAADQE